MLLSIPVSALSTEDFKQGRLSGIAAAEDGTLLISDTYNKVLWRVEGDTVSQFAGVIGTPGLSGEPTGAYHDDTTDKAFFMEPWDIAPFMDGYAVSDTSANVVRYVANGRVYTLAGTGKGSRADGTDKTAAFDRPTGLAVDESGLLYVSDTGSGTIRCIDTTGKVSTFISGLAEPTGLAWYNGALYVAETGRCRICRVADGKLEAFAGVSTAAEDAGEYYGGYADGAASKALFDHPQGVAVGADGTVYIADTGNSAVRAVSDGMVYTLVSGSAEALMPVAPRGLLVQGDTLYVTDQFAGNILTLSIAHKTYRDVTPERWYANAVRVMDRLGIVTGTTETDFEPYAPTSRAMFVTMLSRVYRLSDGSVIIDGDTTFMDVPENKWYSAAVRWAADAGIAGGTGDDSFTPGSEITREQAAVMLYNYAKYAGRLTDEASDLSVFPDSDSVSGWARDAMRWAVGTGLISGRDSGALDPQGSASRAEIVTLLQRYCTERIK